MEHSGEVSYVRESSLGSEIKFEPFIYKRLTGAEISSVKIIPGVNFIENAY